MALKPADKTALQATRDAAKANATAAPALAGNRQLQALHQQQTQQTDAMAAVFHDTLTP